jgi:hypothetical protein
MSFIDQSLVKGPPGNGNHGTGHNGAATLNGVAFRIDPTSVELPMRAKVQKFRTLGGFVVQVYGSTWGDLTVTGQFGDVAPRGGGLGGWRAQMAFLDDMVNLAYNQSIQRPPTLPGQNFTPSQPFRFIYPLLGWDFQCYLKAYTSPDGPLAVHMANQNINPKWALTLFVVTDNGSLTKASQANYLSRLAPGLGQMWDSKNVDWGGYDTDQYNAPLNSAFLQNYVNGGGLIDIVSMTGPPGPADPNSTDSVPGTTGKSVTPPDVSKIKTPNDFSVCLLSELGIVTTDASSPLKVGSAKATNAVWMLNAQQAQEGMWTAYSPSSQRYAGNTHNPLNLNVPSGTWPGYVNIGGTGTLPSWADGVQITAQQLNKNWPYAVGGLLASNFTQWLEGLQLHGVIGPWAGTNDPSDSVNYASYMGYHSSIWKLYNSYGGTDPDNVNMSL